MLSRGIQAAANSYDVLMKTKISELGLKEDKNMYKRNMSDGFKVRFAGHQMVVTYHAEELLKEITP